jgi:hypothetical protein
LFTHTKIPSFTAMLKYRWKLKVCIFQSLHWMFLESPLQLFWIVLYTQRLGHREEYSINWNTGKNFYNSFQGLFASFLCLLVVIKFMHTCRAFELIYCISRSAAEVLMRGSQITSRNGSVGMFANVRVRSPRSSGLTAIRSRNLILLQSVQTGSGAHPASCSLITNVFFPGCEAVGAWSWKIMISPRLRMSRCPPGMHRDKCMPLLHCGEQYLPKGSQLQYLCPFVNYI